MAHLEGTPKQEFRSGAFGKFSNVLRGLVGSLVNIHEAESCLLKLENDDRSPNVSVEMVKTMIERVKFFIESIPETQELLVRIDQSFPAAPGDHASYKDVMVTKQLAIVDMTTSEAEANLAVEYKESTLVKPIRADQSREVSMCRHSCSHHPEVMDISLWRKLPTDLVECVCAYLPVSSILELRKLSKAWSRMPTAANFTRACAKAHPKMLGILGAHTKSNSLFLAVFDFRSYEWVHLELKGIPDIYTETVDVDPIFGLDGGLISILPNIFSDLFEDDVIPSILVFNPLTGDRKFIPVSDTSRKGEAVILQLLMDADTGGYKLLLVTIQDRSDCGRVYEAESYDSKSGLWSAMDSGLVFGTGCSSQIIVFDCTSKSTVDCNPFAFDTALVRDRRFELLQTEPRDPKAAFPFEVCESVWQ